MAEQGHQLRPQRWPNLGEQQRQPQPQQFQQFLDVMGPPNYVICLASEEEFIKKKYDYLPKLVETIEQFVSEWEKEDATQTGSVSESVVAT